MFTYPKAPIVKPGDYILASQWETLAQAFIARFKLGPSCPWRLLFYTLSAFRQVRNPDEEGNFPAQGEFFNFYQLLNAGGSTWPETGPGDIEGANLQSQMNAIVFGNADIQFPDETSRLTDPSQGGLALGYSPTTSTPVSFWNLAKMQRGTIDFTTGTFNSPALEAASSASFLRYTASSPHGLAYGDFLAGPVSAGPCTPPSGPNYPNFQLIFTQLVSPFTVLTYGTCESNPGDVAGVADTPWSFVIFFYDGTTKTLPRNTWVEGPYSSNPSLTKTQNLWLRRVYQKFAGDWRGAGAPPASTAKAVYESLLLDPEKQAAFNNQLFWTSQYQLSPQRGTLHGDTLTDQYRRFTLPSGASQNYEGPLVGSFDVTDSVMTSALLYAENLLDSASVSIYQTINNVKTKVLTLVAEKQSDKTWQAFDSLLYPTPGGVVTAEVDGVASFTGTPKLWVEFTELLPYTPNIADTMLILRLGGITFAGGSSLDGTGINNGDAINIWKNYLNRGCITAVGGSVALPGSDDAVNTNALWDAARRLSLMTRWVQRFNVIGYAVENGNSVLWFNRLAYGSNEADLFEGIGPSNKPIVSGNLLPKTRYRVQGPGAVVYDKRTYGPGAEFTTNTTATFTGSGSVYEVEGIITTAAPGGVTNEWLMGLELYPVGLGETSLWTNQDFSDQIGPFNRCLFCDHNAGSDQIVLNHMAFGQAIGFNIAQPESPDAFNYVPTPGSVYGGSGPNANTGATADFYSSCRLFEPWPSIMSVQADLTKGPNVVKVTLAGRVHHHAAAPSSIANTPSTWDFSGQTYRTWENGIQAGILYQTTGAIAPFLVGDETTTNDCASFDDPPGPCILPRFYFIRMPRRPAPGAGYLNDVDTPTWFDEFLTMEMMLRAICEGYVDSETTAKNACNDFTIGVFNFTYEELLRQSSEGQWMSPVAWTPTAYLGVNDVAGQRQEAAGPLPTCIMAAQVFNQFSAAINLLDTIPVYLPATLQYQSSSASLSVSLPFLYNALSQPVGPGYPANGDIGQGGSFALWLPGPFSLPAASAFTGWLDWAGFSQTAGSGAVVGVSEGYTTGVGFTSTRQDFQYRWVPSGDANNALPVPFQGMLSSSPALFAQVNRFNAAYTPQLVVGSLNGTSCSAPPPTPDAVWSQANGFSILWNNPYSAIAPATCEKLVGGNFAAPPLPQSDSFTCADPFTPGVSNSFGPSSSIEVSPLFTTIPTITVPLV